ncbi:hypothetical protein KCU93_g388, partial [Aureobasidium melanogenum]
MVTGPPLASSSILRKSDQIKGSVFAKKRAKRVRRVMFLPLRGLFVSVMPGHGPRSLTFGEICESKIHFSEISFKKNFENEENDSAHLQAELIPWCFIACIQQISTEDCMNTLSDDNIACDAREEADFEYKATLS